MSPEDSKLHKLRAIIGNAYQIAGAHNAPAHVLDVLSDPDAATAEEVEAMLPYTATSLSADYDYAKIGLDLQDEVIRCLKSRTGGQLGEMHARSVAQQLIDVFMMSDLVRQDAKAWYESLPPNPKSVK